jgi:hypothetical protein
MPLLEAMSRANDGEESRAWLPILVDAKADDVDFPLPDPALSGGGEVVGSSLFVD